jgi:cytochrome P450
MKAIRAIHPIFIKHAKLFAENLREYDGKSIDFVFEITRVTLNIITEVIGAQQAPPEFHDSMTFLVNHLGHPLMTIRGGGYVLRHLLFRRHIKLVENFVYKTIHDRIDLRKRGNTRNVEQKDYLDLLLEAEENGLRFSPPEIKDHLLVFFLAGHETTANTLSVSIPAIICSSKT